MKIKIDRKVFAQALSEVAPFAPAKPMVPILKNAKITTKGTRMKIEANDTQCSMTKYINVIECDAEDSFLVNITDFNKFISKTKGDVIEMAVDDNIVRVKHSTGNAEFHTEDAKEYPVFKMPESESTEVMIPSDLLIEAISKGRGFVMTDTLKPQMCAIYAYIREGTFGFCATDTHKLIHGKYPASSDTDVNWYIMPPIFSALMTGCKNTDNVKVIVTPTHVSYRFGNTIISSGQAKGKYPDFQRVIPQTWRMECVAGKNDMMDAMSRVSLFCDSSQCVKFDISRIDMSLSVDNIDYMKSTKENIPHNGCDGEIVIGVNADHIAVALSAFNGDVRMRIDNEARPILMVSDSNINIQCIVMPMQITNG